MSKEKKVLLFCTGFFSYDKIIKKSLEKNGYQVTLFDERAFKGVIGKSLVRLGWRKLTQTKIKSYYKNIYDHLSPDYDFLLIVNPECITPESIKLFRSKCSKVVIYMWDSFLNKPGAKSLIESADKFFTFDPLDAETSNLIFKPLFFSSSYYNLVSYPELKYDISFVGTVHSDRYRIVKFLTKQFNSYVFFYCPGIFIYLYKRFIIKEIKNVKYKDVSFHSMSEKEVVDVIRNSKAVIDISHPKQRGLTMRTLESLGAQKKIITSNQHVIDYDFYNDSNFLIINDKISPESITSFLRKEYIPTDQHTYEKYHVDQWVKDFIRD
ncbi:hypothetical protein ABEH87_01330 [Erwinia sp. Eh17-17]|uniref:hypothetical protein n=1 Tax=Erwinia sp. Eh17-17 TaxID=3080330 RepID=UPI003208BAE1